MRNNKKNPAELFRDYSLVYKPLKFLKEVNMIKKILITVVVLIVVFVIIVAMQPVEFRYARNSTFEASPSALFEKTNNLNQWQEWSPWAKIDPNCKMTFGGPDAGVGTSFSWDGNNDVGAGTMTITESHPNDLISIKLEFKKPFESTNATEFTFKADGQKTIMSWTMSGKNNFISKAFGLFVNCDKMIGDQFNKGFDNLKNLSNKK